MLLKIKIISIIGFVMILSVKTNLAQELVSKLWDDNIPGAISNDSYQEIDSDKGGWIRISKVVDPTITVYLPENTMQKVPAVLICPGGGYSRLAYDHEGKEVAQWLNKQGIAGMLLKYRLPSDEIMENKTIGPLQDAQRAIRLIREHAGDWNIDPAKVGVMGFSAGGHLAASLTTLYDMPVYKNTGQWKARPDFSILVYGVISMQDSLTHKGSQINLLGPDPSKELIDQFSNELHVDNNTPPCFLVHSSDDKAVNYLNSMLFYEALVKNGVKAELHVYDNGGHGYGLATRKNGPKKWPENLSYWLSRITSVEE